MCISGFKNRFLPEIVLITLRAVGLQIKFSLAFWKALYVYCHVPKYQIWIRYVLEIIGLGVRPVLGGTKAEQQNWWIVFEGFPTDFEVILFLRIPGDIEVCEYICFWILGLLILGFWTRKLSVLESDWENRGLCFVPMFWSGSSCYGPVLDLKFLQELEREVMESSPLVWG